MTIQKQKFQIVQDTIKVYQEKDAASDDDALFIRGIANSGLEDRDGDIVTSEALESICEQSLNCNLHFEHGRQIKDITGTITESRIVEQGVEIVARIRGKCKQFIQELLDDGIKLGLSIAGLVEYEENNLSNISKWDLTEISLVAIPCDPRTMGTVTLKSFNDIKKELEVKSMADEITVDTVTELINEAVNEVKEEFGTKVEEIEGKIAELEAKIAELTPAPEDEGESEVEESVEESLTGDDVKAMLDDMKKDITDSMTQTLDDNMLEFVTKAFNKQENMRQPSFKFVDTAKQEEDGEHVPTSKEVADMIIKGQL